MGRGEGEGKERGGEDEWGGGGSSEGGSALHVLVHAEAAKRLALKQEREAKMLAEHEHADLTDTTGVMRLLVVNTVLQADQDQVQGFRESLPPRKGMEDHISPLANLYDSFMADLDMAEKEEEEEETFTSSRQGQEGSAVWTRPGIPGSVEEDLCKNCNKPESRHFADMKCRVIPERFSSSLLLPVPLPTSTFPSLLLLLSLPPLPSSSPFLLSLPSLVLPSLRPPHIAPISPSACEQLRRYYKERPEYDETQFEGLPIQVKISHRFPLRPNDYEYNGELAEVWPYEPWRGPTGWAFQ
eukprot:761743-Hanusia_phi.AAC.1